jgi:hypothetical protein
MQAKRKRDAWGFASSFGPPKGPYEPRLHDPLEKNLDQSIARESGKKFSPLEATLHISYVLAADKDDETGLNRMEFLVSLPHLAAE